MSKKKCLNKIISFNKKYWQNKEEERNTSEVVLFEIRKLPFHTISLPLAAKITREFLGEKVKTVSISFNLFNKDNWKILRSFYIGKIEFIANSIIYFPIFILRSFYIAFRYYLKIKFFNYKFINFINEFTVNDIEIGDLIYDSYIRYEHRYKRPYAHILKFSYILFVSLVKFYFTFLFFRKYKVRFSIVGSWYYADIGSFINRISFKKNIPVLMINGIFIKSFNSPKYLYQEYTKVFPDDILNIDKSKAYHYLKERFKGSASELSRDSLDIEAAYKKDKKILTKDNFYKELGINSGHQKKIVALMAHGFSDANHAAKRTLFRDYFEWLEETLKYCSTANDENIYLVKAHPVSEKYGETQIFQELVDKYQDGVKILLCPKSINTITVLRNCDLITTVRGTAALEAVYFGTSALIAGDAEFSDFSFINSPLTKEDYFNCLSNIDLNKKIVKEDSVLAGKALYFYKASLNIKSKVFFEPKVTNFVSTGVPESYIESLYCKLHSNLVKNNGYLEDDYYYKISDQIKKVVPDEDSRSTQT